MHSVSDAVLLQLITSCTTIVVVLVTAWRTRASVKNVHAIVNSASTLQQQKLDEALARIASMTIEKQQLASRVRATD